MSTFKPPSIPEWEDEPTEPGLYLTRNQAFSSSEKTVVVHDDPEYGLMFSSLDGHGFGPCHLRVENEWAGPIEATEHVAVSGVVFGIALSGEPHGMLRRGWLVDDGSHRTPMGRPALTPQAAGASELKYEIQERIDELRRLKKKVDDVFESSQKS